VTVLCPVLAQDAIQAALKDYKSKNDDDTDGGQAQSSANWTSWPDICRLQLETSTRTKNAIEAFYILDRLSCIIDYLLFS